MAMLALRKAATWHLLLSQNKCLGCCSLGRGMSIIASAFTPPVHFIFNHQMGFRRNTCHALSATEDNLPQNFVTWKICTTSLGAHWLQTCKKDCVWSWRAVLLVYKSGLQIPWAAIHMPGIYEKIVLWICIDEIECYWYQQLRGAHFIYHCESEVFCFHTFYSSSVTWIV